MTLLAEKSASKLAASPKSPRSLQECPNYQNALKRFQDLQLEVVGAKERINELDSTISRQGSGKVIDSEVNQLLAGELDGHVEINSLKEERATLGHRLSVMEEAVALQEKIVGQELYKASEQITATYLPDYRHIIDKQAEALESLKEIAIEELQFINQINSLGIHWHHYIRRMNFTAIGDVRLQVRDKPASVERIDHWLNEACEYDFI